MTSVPVLLSENDIKTIGNQDIIVALMGPSGVGKSSFVNTVLGHEVATVGRTLESCTGRVWAYGCLHPDGSGRKVIMVDTPGFDNTHGTDYEVLSDIVDWLTAVYKREIVLTGIIYLRSIAEARMPGTRRNNLEVFRQLCGNDALKNVSLTTTFWDKVPVDIATMREDRLKTEFCGHMIKQGCRIKRFHPPTMDTAWTLISELDNGARRRALVVQQEIVDQGKKFHQTSAFEALFDWWKKRLGSLNSRFVEYNPLREKELKWTEKEIRKMTRRNSTRSSFRDYVILRETGEGATGVRATRKGTTGEDTALNTSQSLPSYLLHGINMNLERVLSDSSSYKEFLKLRDKNAQKVLDILLMLLEHSEISSQQKGYLGEALIRLATKSSQYPSSVILEEGISHDDVPYDNGQFGEIYKGTIHQTRVCLKVLKVYQKNNMIVVMQSFLKEGLLWKQLSHPNILPLYGMFVLQNKANRPCLISPWMNDGNVMQYISNNPNTNRYLLISDIAEGVMFLHAKEIVHGDIKGVNVLVDEVGRGRLADFGLSNLMLPHLPSWTSVEYHLGCTGTTRWQAPELFSEDAQQITKSCDIYSFASTCYEILTGTIPYSEIQRNETVMLKVASDNKLSPKLPQELEATINPLFWNIIQSCWNRTPELRPTIEDVVERLRPHIPEDVRLAADPELYLAPPSLRRLLEEQSEKDLIRDVEIILNGIATST